jgi:predicted CopG family antitoxin
MRRKLTISVDQQVYEKLQDVAGRRKISRLIESLVQPHVPPKGLTAAYRQMAKDEVREAEAREWANATIGDAAHEAR